MHGSCYAHMQWYNRLTSIGLSPPQESYFSLIAKSSTLYIGNLAFITTEEQVGAQQLWQQVQALLQRQACLTAAAAICR